MSGTPAPDGEWRITGKTEMYASPPWISVKKVAVQLPDGTHISDFHQIDLHDYVMIYAITPEKRIITLDQYRLGVGGRTLILPGGTIEDGEDPLEAGKRELLEETGFCSSNWKVIGSFVSNVNYGCGQATVVMASEAAQVSAPSAPDMEGGEILYLDEAELLKSVQSGEVKGAGSALAILLAQSTDH